jgi:hypothetical protein
MIGAQFRIPFKDKLHGQIVQAIVARKQHSEQKMSDRYESWRKRDEEAVGFIKPREVDTLRAAAKKSDGIVDYVTVEVPYSYGMMMAAHTYWSSVFLNRNPVFQYEGRHGEAENSVLATESLMNYQLHVGKMLVPLYIWLYDAGKYGAGVVGGHWDEETRYISQIVEEPIQFLGAPTGKNRKIRRTTPIVGYQGNRLYNVRPFKFFFDPRVTLANLQAGEYAGRETEMNWTDIVKGEKEGRYFNIDQVKTRMKSSAVARGEQGSSRVEYPDPDHQVDTDKMRGLGFIQIWEFYIRLIPKDWGLGKSEFPEIWAFTVAGEEVIIGARPLGEIHDHFPFWAIEQEIEGYSLFKRSILEQMEPLNDIITWLFNSHFYNVRAALNNQFIYDPSRLTMKDILDPSPGKRIRVKPDAYGQDIRTMFQQVPTADVTGRHLGDLDNVGQMMQRASGIVDNIMGMVNQGGRKTATEVRTSSSFGINRLKTTAEYMSAMGFAPLSEDLLVSSQQHYSLDRKFRIVGDTPAGQSFVQVTPESLAGFYDFVPVDGTLPIDRFAQANLWKEMMIAIQNNIQVAQSYDIAGIFAYIAQLSGLRNIGQFRVSVGQPGAVEGAADKGNLIPLRQGINEAEPKQIPNLGPTG